MSSISASKSELVLARKELLRAGLFEDARKLELAYLGTSPDDANVHFMAGWTANSLRDFAAAAYHYRRSADLSPTHEAYNAWASVERKLGNTAEAKRLQQLAEAAASRTRAEFDVREKARKKASLRILEQALELVLPSWCSAIDRSPVPRFENLLLGSKSDFEGDWIRFAGPAAAEGSVTELGKFGRFRVGNVSHVVHKRLSRRIPWELVNAVLLIELASRCDREALILDVGANVGTLTVPVGKAFAPGKVIAFEPVHSTFDELIDNVQLNQLVNVDAQMAACSSSPGSGTMYDISADNPGVAKLSKDSGGTTSVTTIDEAVQGRAVGLIKMDIEGHEPEALRGGLKTLTESRPLILCELLASSGGPTRELLEELGYQGFKVHRCDWLFHLP